MQRRIYPKKLPFTRSEQMSGGYIYNAPVAPTVGVTLPPGTERLRHFHGVRLQPSDVCVKNFMIFDQSDDVRQIMFHPTLTPKFNCSIFNTDATLLQDYGERKDKEGGESGSTSSSLKEDMEDIDTLLSLDEVEQDDEEEVSTAWTIGSCGSNSPDSCSSYGSKPKKLRLSSSPSRKSSSSSNGNSERKRYRIKKMVKTLQGIVPGAEQMNTADILDEAVRYLKSLKMEVKKNTEFQ